MRLRARQRCTDAVVHRTPEPEVGVGGALRNETVGLGEDKRVTAARGEHQRQGCPTRDGDASQVDVSECGSGAELLVLPTVVHRNNAARPVSLGD